MKIDMIYVDKENNKIPPGDETAAQYYVKCVLDALEIHPASMDADQKCRKIFFDGLKASPFPVVASLTDDSEIRIFLNTSSDETLRKMISVCGVGVIPGVHKMKKWSGEEYDGIASLFDGEAGLFKEEAGEKEFQEEVAVIPPSNTSTAMATATAAATTPTSTMATAMASAASAEAFIKTNAEQLTLGGQFTNNVNLLTMYTGLAVNDYLPTTTHKTVKGFTVMGSSPDI